MNNLIKKELEIYRKATIKYWNTVNKPDLAKDTKYATDEELLLGAIITAKNKMKEDTKEYEKYLTWKKKEDILENMEE